MRMGENEPRDGSRRPSLDQARGEYLALIQEYVAQPQRSRKASSEEMAEWWRRANTYLAALDGRPDTTYANLELFTYFVHLMVALARLAFDQA
jgi:hypothetical protein